MDEKDISMKKPEPPKEESNGEVGESVKFVSILSF